MPRYRQELDDQIIEDGDAGFVGVNALLEPGLLRTAYQYGQTNENIIGPGLVSDARNKRFVRGHAETRPGTITPVQFNPAGGWGTIYGTGVFSDPNGTEWLLIATAAGVYRTRDGVGPTSLITLEAGFAISGECELVQAFDRVILFRGPDGEPLVWSGLSSDVFRAVPDPGALVSFLERIPNASYAVLMSGRIFLPVGRDQIAVSDLLDYTSWDSALNTFRVNAGEDDGIVALYPFRRTSMVIFKDRSIYRLLNVEGDLQEVSAEVVNSTIGCVARRSVAGVGGDLFWLAREGVMRLTELVQESMTAQEIPVSEPIRPWIERINWEYAHLSCARAHDRYYFLAVPLDNQTRPQTLLVYDTTSRQWQGMDTFPAGVSLDRLHVARWLGQRRLFSVDISGRVLVHGVGRSDDISGTIHQIPDLVQTRGYVGQTNQSKRWRHAELEVATWNPSVQIRAVVPGVAEERLVLAFTRDRTRYLTHGRGVHDVTNGAIQGAQDRQDYHVLSSDGVDSDAGVQPELEQVTRVGLTIREAGRWCALRIENDWGTCSVRFCKLDGRIIQNQRRIQQ